MCAPGDIPDVPEMGLVWLIDGERTPFTDVSEARRPWLEESVSWNSPWGDGPGPADGDDGEGTVAELVWF